VKPDVVVDIGNTRIKWGRCAGDRVQDMAGLPPDDPAAWERQVAAWELPSDVLWVVAGVHPERRGRFLSWLTHRSQRFRLIDSHRHLPLQVRLSHPEKVGLDRLLNAVAAKTVRTTDFPAVLVDAGSAVTVDHVDAAGAFCGGAIFPGCRLMAQALHDYTALLPLVEVSTPPAITGTATAEAIQAGIFWTVLGGIRTLLEKHQLEHESRVEFFLTGGDGELFRQPLVEHFSIRCWPLMTLEGIRLAALYHNSLDENVE
jgi:type III pantothenate kinase